MYIKEPSPTLILLQKGVSCAAHGRCKRGEAPVKLRARAPARSPKAPKKPKTPKKPSSDRPRFQDVGDCSTGLCGPRTGAPTEPSPEVKKLIWEAGDCTTGLCGRSDEAADKLRARAPAGNPKASKKPKTPKKPSPLPPRMGDCSTGLCGGRTGAPAEELSPELKQQLRKMRDCTTGLCQRGEPAAKLHARARKAPKTPKTPKKPKKPSPKLGFQDDMGDCSTGLCRNRPAPEPKTDCDTGLCRRGEVDAE
ncbi:hypothetical protein MAPG_03484 [Magnaporthiopsis poae ATCC 64411]|uniref:Uncharacterized protein n=1 Tax=Magnaporthiopsis poae (strain ATCC 64411 / 73-15) TaxID=644358 RepID=A0A0C4DU49_MAGP6|nr:hypothetical protein MAPG_03484 [Magnaporthiopsis poae ATCC 64411]